MTSLFDSLPAMGAVFSPCRRYRYRLWRRWGPGPSVAFLMLNPSTADEVESDPTVTRCIHFAMDFNFGGLEVLNVYGYLSTLPRPLWSGVVEDPVGPDNDRAILDVAKTVAYVVCAWGAFPKAQYRGLQVLASLEKAKVDTRVLHLTEKGCPGHPLYLPAGLTPFPWRGR